MHKNLLPFDAVMLALLVFFLLPSPAHAYFDLGMGTYMLQILFGFGAALWFSFKSSWLKKTKPKEKNSTTQDSADDAQKPLS